MYQGEMPQIAMLDAENDDGCVKVALLGGSRLRSLRPNPI
jgi:hypothetical protein